jgi:NAD(P)-dependent dehydrogenase (short-subunit alcohol dehydrogenase family)
MTHTVVVLGATGAVGSEVTAELLARGHHVIAVARNAERLQALAGRVNAGERLALIARSVANEFDASLLVQALREQPRQVTAVVASLRGSVESGRLLDRSASDLLRALDQDVVTHFIAAKHLLPLLAESGEDGLYLTLSGPMGACAWSGYGHLSVAAASLQMLTRVVREEAKELPVIVQQLQIGTPVRSEANAGCACPDWLGADEVARRVATLVEHRSERIPIVELGVQGERRRPPRIQGAHHATSTSTRI